MPALPQRARCCRTTRPSTSPGAKAGPGRSSRRSRSRWRRRQRRADRRAAAAGAPARWSVQSPSESASPPGKVRPLPPSWVVRMRRIVSSVAVVVLVAACTTIATRPFDDLFGPSRSAALRPPGRAACRAVVCADHPAHPRPSLRGLPRLLRRALPAQDDQLGRAGARREQDAGVRRRAGCGRRRRRACTSMPTSRRSGGHGTSRRCSTSTAPTPEANRRRRPDAPPAGAQAAASAADRGRRRRRAGLLARPVGDLPGGGGNRPLRARDAPGRHALRPAGPERGRAPACSRSWLEQGAPYEGPAAPTPLATQRVAQWERFFNGDSLKERLFSRYAYEHLFLAHLYFDDDPAAPVLPAGALGHAAGAAAAADRQPAARSTTRAWLASTTGSSPSARPSSPRRTCPTPWARSGWRAGARCSSTRRARWTACRATARRRPPIPSPPSRTCRSRRATASCSTRRSSRSWASSRGRCAAARWRSTSSRTTSGSSSSRPPAAPTRRSRPCWRATSTCCACRPAAAARRS